MAWYGIRSNLATAFAFMTVIAGWTMDRSGDASVVTFSKLSNVPSHNGGYRASMTASTNSQWTIEIQTASGTRVPNASLALESWMPDEERFVAVHPRVSELAEGRYRVDGLRLDRPGWWNVKLAISAASGTDSLAFNLVRQ
jgi:hypothetical protein